MKVAIFVTCLVDNFYPDVAEAMVRILHHYGVEVVFPDQQTCCGQPAFNSGYVDDARAVAGTMLEAFAEADYVLSPSGSCTGMIHHYYPKLFDEHGKTHQQAQRLAQRTFEFSQFLVNVLGVTDVGATFAHTVTYHPSCHGTRLLGVRDEPLTLLRQVRNLEFRELPYASDCCGFGGTFAVKMSEISTAMVHEKTEHVLETDVEVLVGTDMGCLMNIGGRLHRQGAPIRVMHLAQLLWEGMSVAQGVSG